MMNTHLLSGDSGLRENSHVSATGNCNGTERDFRLVLAHI
jgi:hypothetical protein